MALLKITSRFIFKRQNGIKHSRILVTAYLHSLSGFLLAFCKSCLVMIAWSATPLCGDGDGSHFLVGEENGDEVGVMDMWSHVDNFDVDLLLGEMGF